MYLKVSASWVWLPWQQKAVIDFLLNHWSDVSHFWQLWSVDDCLPSLYVFWQVAIFIFVAIATFSFEKKDFFKWQFWNHYSSITLTWYKSCLGKGNSKYSVTLICRSPKELRNYFELSEVRDKQIVTSPIYMYKLSILVESAFLQRTCMF